MRPRPGLDVVARLVMKHRGNCPQPCDGCELAAEVVGLLRVLRYVTRLPSTSIKPSATWPEGTVALVIIKGEE